jgi:arabinogalactan oligomer / maltooligosaccharide transport system permease protein
MKDMADMNAPAIVPAGTAAPVRKVRRAFHERFDKRDKWPFLVMVYLILIVCSFVAIYPVLNILTISLRPGASLFSTSLAIIPPNATFENYINAYRTGGDYPALLWTLNSLLVAVLTALVSIVVSINAGYVFARFRFKGRRTGLTMLLVTQMFPATMLMLPLYLMIVQLRLLNNYLGLILVYVSISVPFNIWMMKGYYDTIPRSLEESAYVDGSNTFHTYYKIILPLATPAIALTALFGFMTAWSEFLVARLLITRPNLMLLPVGLINLQGSFSTEWGLYSAVALVSAVPVTILFIALSRYLVGGLTLGSVKG